MISHTEMDVSNVTFAEYLKLQSKWDSENQTLTKEEAERYLTMRKYIHPLKYVNYVQIDLALDTLKDPPITQGFRGIDLAVGEVE